MRNIHEASIFDLGDIRQIKHIALAERNSGVSLLPFLAEKEAVDEIAAW